MNKSIKRILLILLALTPFFGMFEAIGFLGFKLPIDIVFVKSIKIILIYIAFSICFIRTLLLKFSLIHPFLLVISFFLFLVIILSTNPYFILAGFNWLLPFIIMFLLVGVVDDAFLKKTAKILFYVLCLNTLMQVYQMFYMPAYQGANVFGLSGRLRGFFAISSISAVFTCYVYFVIKYHSNFSPRKKNISYLLVYLSVFFAMSSAGAGLLVLMLILPKFLKSKFKALSFVVLIPLIVLAVTNLDTLSGRTKGQSGRSFSIRQKILIDQIYNADLISPNFGKATNFAVNINRKLGINNEAFIADMMYTSILTNMGWIFFIIVMFFIICSLFKVFHKKQLHVIIFFIISISAAASQIISEMYPVNYIIAICGAYYINPKNKF